MSYVVYYYSQLKLIPEGLDRINFMRNQMIVVKDVLVDRSVDEHRGKTGISLVAKL